MEPADRPASTARRGTGRRTGRLAPGLRRAARSVAAVLAECHYAHCRLLQLRQSPDRYVIGGGQAPGTYAEFLARTSGWLRHEPPAEKRFTGRPSRR